MEVSIPSPSLFQLKTDGFETLERLGDDLKNPQEQSVLAVTNFKYRWIAETVSYVSYPLTYAHMLLAVTKTKVRLMNQN